MLNKVRTDVIINIIRTVVLTLLSFITFPWVCRYLGATQVGAYTWATTFVSYFLILAKIGIPNLAVRECIKVRNNKEILSNKVQMFFYLQLLTTLLSFILMLILVFSVKEFYDNSSLIFILSLNFLIGAFSFEWVFIALEKQFYMAVRSIATLTISAILVVIMVTSPADILIYALIAISVTLLTTISNLFYIGKFISFKKTLPYELKPYIKPLLILCALSLTLSFYNQTDTFILGFIDESKNEVGSYSVGVKGIDIIIGIITALSMVFIPRAAYCYNQENKIFFNNINKYSINIALFLILPAIALMSTLSKNICGLISGNYTLSNNEGFDTSFIVLIILSSMMLTYSLSEIIYGQILLPMKKEKYYLFAMLGGTILNIVLSLILSKYAFKEHPSIGVAIGTMVTDTLILLYLLKISWKWSKIAIFNKNTLKIALVSLVLMVLSLLLKKPFYQLGLLFNKGEALALGFSLITILLLSIIIYIFALYFLKENLIMSFKKKGKEDGQ